VIIAAKHPVSVGPSLRAAGLTADELFTHVHGSEKAEVLRRIRAAVYVGDTRPDIAAGLSPGVRAVGVATGSFSASQLCRAGADLVLTTLEAFPAWYQGGRQLEPAATLRNLPIDSGRPG
jgi:phosphoglycolate phosphatase-like HAD superfamily hydrolase